jgi:flagellar biosynthesis chaperone FliJ
VERAQEAEARLAEVERGGEQVNAELQQLREQLTTLTRERDRYRNQLAGAIEHSKAPEAQAQLVDRLQAWLRPVLEVVADHPDDTSILAVSVLEFLPQIASRLIEE